MQHIFKFFLFVNLFIFTHSIELGLWRGTTHYYSKFNNHLDLSNPYIITYNYSNNFNRSYNNYNNIDKKQLIYKLLFNDNINAIILNINRYNDFFNNQINFYYNITRSIININYQKNNKNLLDINYITVSALRCGLLRTTKLKNKINNISILLYKLKSWKYCKYTFINTNDIFHKNINILKGNNIYDYEYFFNKKDYISNIFIDNLVICIPSIINNKPFSMLYGCFINDESYKQIVLNYNFNNKLISIEFNEYEPNILKNKTISFHNKVY